MLIYLMLLIIAAAIAAIMTKAVRDLANKFGLAFAPDSSRHIHAVPIPRLGGVAIFFTVLIISLLYWIGVRLGFIHQAHSLAFLKILIPASGLFAVGLIDDLRGLSAKTKLAAQVIGGAVLYLGGFRLVCLDNLSDNHYVSAV